MAEAAGPRRLNRRTALGGAISLPLASLLGCTVGSTPAKPVPTRPGDASRTGPGDLDPAATATILSALAAVLAHRSQMEALTAAYPQIEARAEQVVEMHLAHQAFLAGLLRPEDLPVAPTPALVTVDRRGLRKVVVASLAAHESTVTALAIPTPTPALARALASIAAATAQVAAATGWAAASQEGTLPAEPGPVTDQERAALQRVLQREHASLWWYGVLGARTSAGREPDLFGALAEGYRAHRRQRDQLDACLRSLGVEPLAAEPAYPLTWPTRSAPQRALAAGAIEHDAAATYGWMVAQISVLDKASNQALMRHWAVTALRNAAIRELVGQETPEKFPGADEIAER